MFEKILIFILTTVMAVIGFLTASFFDGFVTKADYNRDKAAIEVIANDVLHIKKKVDDISNKLD